MPKGARSIHFSFDENHLTHFGGMWLIQRFCNKLQLRRLIQRYVKVSGRTTRYHPAELIVGLLFAIIMGLRRINKTDILQYNGTFLSLPHQRNSLVFDVDSTVLIIYSRAEGARVGYNPKKPGRRSYHPLLCFEEGFQEFWHGSLRPGNASASTGAVSFLKVCLAKAPSTIARSRMRFRMDSGFYGSRVIRFLDASGCGYVMVAREYHNIKARARACRFQGLGNGWQVAEFREKVHHKMKRPHRFVVVRRPIPRDPEDSAQLTLFKDRKYAYHVLVTNLTLSPWRVYRFYSVRATIEKNIREFVYDYPLGKIPTDTWTANVAFFQLVLFAADIVHWFKRMCLPPHYLTTTLDSIRTDFLVLPARLVRQSKRNVVKLPHDYHYRREFLDASRKVDRLRLPRQFRICK